MREPRLRIVFVLVDPEPTGGGGFTVCELRDQHEVNVTRFVDCTKRYRNMTELAEELARKLSVDQVRVELRSK